VPTAIGRAHQLYDARMPDQVIPPGGGSGRDGPASGARAEAILPGCVGSIALVARKTSGGSGA